MAAQMLSADKIKYLVQLFAPLLLLPVLSEFTLVAVPILVMNLLSTFLYQYNIRYHYTSLLIATLMAAAVLALDKAPVLVGRRILAVGLCVAAMWSAALWGPFQWSQVPEGVPDPKGPEAAALREAIALIPEDAVVCARSRFTTHLTHRKEIYDYPTPFWAAYWGDNSLRGKRLPEADRVEYVLERPDRMQGPAAEIWPTLADEGFVPIYSKEGVVLLKRVESATREGGSP